jgi:hypothetical protein
MKHRHVAGVDRFVIGTSFRHFRFCKTTVNHAIPRQTTLLNFEDEAKEFKRFEM